MAYSSLQSIMSNYGREIALTAAITGPDYNGTSTTTSYTADKIVGCTFTADGQMFKSVMQGAELELDGATALAAARGYTTARGSGPAWAKALVGAKVLVTLTASYGGSSQSRTWPTFTVKDAEYRDDTDSIVLYCYDGILATMVQYDTNAEYATGWTMRSLFDRQTHFSYLPRAIGLVAGLKIDNAIYPGETITNATVDLPQSATGVDPFSREVNPAGGGSPVSVSDYTFRDVLDYCAEATGGTICVRRVGANDVLTVVYPTSSGITISPSDLKESSIDDVYGPVNALVLGRTPQEDNVYSPDPLPTPTTAVRFDNNVLMDYDRDAWLPGLYSRINGLTYSPYEITTTGQACLDIGEQFTLEMLDGTSRTCIWMGQTLEIAQGVSETGSCGIPGAAETDYGIASPSDRTAMQTILRVDKAEGSIESLTSITTEQGTSISTLTQTAEGIEGRVSNTETAINNLTGSVETVTSQVNAKLDADSFDVSVEKWIEENGIQSVDTQTGMTFDADGLHINQSGASTETLIDATGMTVSDYSGNDVLTATAEGVDAVNLHATTYLIVGQFSRFQDYSGTDYTGATDNQRTACYWIEAGGA